MIFVEGGTFTMGCTPEQGNCYAGERPTHKVTLTDFFMGEFQVTQKLWRAVMDNDIRQQWMSNQIADRESNNGINASIEKINELKEKTGGVPIPPLKIAFDASAEGLIQASSKGGKKLPREYFNLFNVEKYSGVIPINGAGDNYPVYFLSYNNCELFCNRLNELLVGQLPEGYRFCMPTEAQWEYAARGGNLSKGYRFSGSHNLDEVAWFENNSHETTHEVGKKMKNELGIYDMSGNVWEWCRDRYSEKYYSKSSAINPKGPDIGNEFILRGGSWIGNEWCCRIASRHKDDPAVYAENYGFRLCLEPSPKLSGSGFFGYSGNFTTSRLSSGKNLTFKANNMEFEMVFVEGGTFAMGCSAEHNNIDFRHYICDNNEKPVHNVKLSNFYMGKFEVTQKLWQTVMGTTLIQQRDLANPDWELYGEGDNYPVYYVSYEGCVEFCNKLNKLLYTQLPEGYEFVLPTEAQWEYAARGGKKSRGYTYSGSNFINKVAWCEENCEKKMRETGRKFKNELGIFDMSGNVWEWCRDWFEENYYSYASATNPQGPLTGMQRVLRGGSWSFKPWHCRVSTRYFYEPTGRSASVGFRIALAPAKELFDLKSLKDAVNKLSARASSVNNRIFKVDDLYFEMVFVDGGTFTMGCTSNPNDCFENEEPTHSVTVSDFYIGKYQVTQQLWRKVMGSTLQQQRDLGNPEWELYGEGDDYPMYYINLWECEEFCFKLNDLLSKLLPEGYKFALPTEAQWEYAARGGKKSKGCIYSGGDIISKVAWFMENGNDKIQKIGMKKGNELGIYDMSGNVWEWCRDYFDGDYYYISPEYNPVGPEYGFQRALRGGSWRSTEQGCRVSCRYKSSPGDRASNCGLRLALVKE